MFSSATKNSLNNSSRIFDNCVLGTVANANHSYSSIKMVSLVGFYKMIPFNFLPIFLQSLSLSLSLSLLPFLMPCSFLHSMFQLVNACMYFFLFSSSQKSLRGNFNWMIQHKNGFRHLSLDLCIYIPYIWTVYKFCNSMCNV